MTIQSNIFGAAAAFLGGFFIALVNFYISKYFIKKRPNIYSATPIIRQLIQLSYLVIIFLGAQYTPWDRTWLLVAGCIGITLPMLWFTLRLIKINDSLKDNDEKEITKEEPSDG